MVFHSLPSQTAIPLALVLPPAEVKSPPTKRLLSQAARAYTAPDSPHDFVPPTPLATLTQLVPCNLAMALTLVSPPALVKAPPMNKAFPMEAMANTGPFKAP